MKLDVKCPECGLNQKYKPYKGKRERRSQMRKKCGKCGSTFKVSKQLLNKFDEEDKEVQFDGFVKYTGDGYEKIRLEDDNNEE